MILDIKTQFLKVKTVFRGLIAEFDDLFNSSEGNFVTSYLQNWESYQTQSLHQKCFYGHNDSCRVSFQSVDVNLDFWRLGL